MSSKNSHIEPKKIIDRIKLIIGVKNDNEISQHPVFVQSGQAISNWKKRGSIPWKYLYQFCVYENIDMKWLVSGEGKTQSVTDKYSKILNTLKEIESLDYMLFCDTISHISSIAKGLKSNKGGDLKAGGYHGLRDAVRKK